MKTFEVKFIFDDPEADVFKPSSVSLKTVHLQAEDEKTARILIKTRYIYVSDEDICSITEINNSLI
jgi:hypothetical protein